MLLCPSPHWYLLQNNTCDTSEIPSFWLCIFWYWNRLLTNIHDFLLDFDVDKVLFWFRNYRAPLIPRVWIQSNTCFLFRNIIPLVTIVFSLFDLSSNVHKRRKSWLLPNFLFVFLFVSDNSQMKVKSLPGKEIAELVLTRKPQSNMWLHQLTRIHNSYSYSSVTKNSGHFNSYCISQNMINWICWKFLTVFLKTKNPGNPKNL